MIKTTFFIVQILLFLLTILGYFSDKNYILDIFSHFKIQYFILSIFCLFSLMYFRSKIFIIISLLTITLNFLEIKDFLPYKEIKNEGIKVLSYNVLSENNNYQSLISLIKKEKPELIALQEVDLKWNNALKDIYSEYKYIHKAMDSRNGGNILLSNLPVENIETIYYDDKTNFPSIKANLIINNKEYIFIVSHPPNPANPLFHYTRDKILNNMAVDINTNNVIIAGDFNTTMFSNGYKNFIKTGNFKNTREGFSIQSTWSTNNIMFPFQIPIDHIFVSKDIKVNNFEVIKNIGSDHNPILSILNI